MLCPHCQREVSAKPGELGACPWCKGVVSVPRPYAGFGSWLPIVAGFVGVFATVAIVLAVRYATSEAVLSQAQDRAGSAAVIAVPFAMVAGMILLSMVVYFAPVLVAASRQHPDVNAIAILNLFLGWTFIGWVIALVWAFKAHR